MTKSDAVDGRNRANMGKMALEYPEKKQLLSEDIRSISEESEETSPEGTFSGQPQNRNWTGLSHVMLATLAISLNFTAVGIESGYPSPAIPDLNTHPNPFHVTITEQSWIVSVASIGALAGAIVVAVLIDRLGRRTTMMLGGVSSTVGWLIIAASTNTATMVTGRVLLGFSCTFMSTSATVYMAEITPPHIRGLLMSLCSMGITVGILAVFVVGAFVRWNWLAVASTAPSILLVLSLTSLPETPRWLLMKGWTTEATEARVWLNSDAPSDLSGNDAAFREEPLPWRCYFRSPFVKPLVVSQVISLLSPMSGYPLLTKYVVTILQWTGSEMDPYSVSMVLAGFSIFAHLLGATAIDCFSRRALFVISATIMGVGWSAMVSFCYWKDTVNILWLPPIALAVVFFGNGLGVAHISHIINSELFPTRARGRACAVGKVTSCVGFFICAKGFADLTLLAGILTEYTVLACTCFVLAIFAYTAMPETRGLSLNEVEIRFR